MKFVFGVLFSYFLLSFLNPSWVEACGGIENYSSLVEAYKLSEKVNPDACLFSRRNREKCHRWYDVLSYGSEVPRCGQRKLHISRILYFSVGQKELKKDSYPLLRDVAALIKSNPEIKKVIVEGHTDDRGSSLANQRLSEERAKKVVEYLVAKGVEVSRLEVKGYGETRPFAINKTEEDRAKNRRVEFVVLDQ